MFNLMYKIMENLGISLCLIRFAKTKPNYFKVYYGGVFLARQSLISLNKKVLMRFYEMGVFSYTENAYSPDFFQLSYAGLVTSLRYMLEEYLKTLSSSDEFEHNTYLYMKNILS